MKTIINVSFKTAITAILLMLTVSIFAQEGINYQGVARDANGDLIVDTEITIDININEETPDGETRYSETHNITTDAHGVFSLVIGQGTPTFNTFNFVYWPAGSHFLNVWLNGTEVGTTQFTSVPYTLSIGKFQADKNGLTPIGTAGSIYIGQNAGFNEDLTGIRANIGFGSGALNKNTVGVSNVAIGADALYHNLEGVNNIALGLNAIYSNISGENNVAIGKGTLFNNSTGSHNIAIGDNALNSVNTGFSNIALGKDALMTNTSGITNVAIGKGALMNNNSAGSNVVIGANAGWQNVNGTRNVFLGNGAGAQEMGSHKLYIHNSTTQTPLIYGDFMSNLLGFNAKVGIGTQNPEAPLNVVDGTDADLSANSGQLLLGTVNGDNLIMDKNEIQARSNGSASILFLQQNGGDVYVGNAVVHASDKRLKRDINDISYGLNEVLQLRPTEYFWKERTQENKSLGLIAQEVNEVIKNVVTYDEKQDKYGVSYTELIPVLIKAIQEQQIIIDSQQKRNNRQSKDMADLESRLEVIESKLIQLAN
ncbi:tail fiber domain-containing protein [Ichthyenterobacterium magnum]|uniref:Endosialidase-like protein n=1 Tax=Ichthyenterobacterium magnum TaxID=1230530 RepID=A0A420DGS5_9FLAO|nr:tail fiber domain-containing protein [Ichthyenterobacterium magnum]RKE92279.1 endosialidase-like protein [Ichthyenterobacterium magnum]